jgi:hypothetical protein
MTYTAKIYKIVNTINDDIYVGSTKNELRVRWQGHKKFYKKHFNRNGLYEMMNEYPIESFRIVLIEEVKCTNKEDQIKHEQIFIDELKPKLNKRNANGSKCEHNILRSQCKECGGSQICEHNRLRSNCKECGGGSICEHNNYRSRCKECGGSQICDHNRIRSSCKECGGNQICEHNRLRSQCKECGGSHICEHHKRRSSCKECGGSQICEHNKYRSQCKECGGSKTLLMYCKECNIEISKGAFSRHKKSKKHMLNITIEVSQNNTAQI